MNFGAFISRAFLGVVGLYLFTMTIVYTFLLSDLFIAPQLPISLELFNTKIKTNEQLKYLATFRRNKPCRSEIQRFVIFRDKAAIEALEQQGIVGSSVSDGKETDFVGYRDSIIGIITQGATETIKTVSVLNHPPFPVGHYVLRIFVVSSCNIITRVDPYPDAPFEVVE